MRVLRARTLRLALALFGIAVVTSACFVVVDPGRGHRQHRHYQHRDYNRP